MRRAIVRQMPDGLFVVSVEVLADPVRPAAVDQMTRLPPRCSRSATVSRL